MPVTTFRMSDPPVYPDEDIAEMLAELTEKTGEEWFAADYVTTQRRFLGHNTTTTYPELLKKLPAGDYQILMCVNNRSTLRAYLFGALGQLD